MNDALSCDSLHTCHDVMNSSSLLSMKESFKKILQHMLNLTRGPEFPGVILEIWWISLSRETVSQAIISFCRTTLFR